MQLAHYTRMLQACGRHPGDELLLGAIVGTSEVAFTPDAPATWVLAWHNLAEPVVYTYSRSRGKTKRSLLERYDHEHAFRVKVAHRALQIVGSPGDPATARHADRTGRVRHLPIRGPVRRGDGRRSIGSNHRRQARHPRVAHAAVDGRHHDPRARRVGPR